MDRPTWSTAEHLLAEWDGAATEIFVVGLPLSRLPLVIGALSALPELQVTMFDGNSFEPEPFSPAWKMRLETCLESDGQIGLVSARGSAMHLQIYLWPDSHAVALEVELVFWNDWTFPPELAADEREQRLQALVGLAEACRAGVPGAICLLAPEHNGATEELLRMPERRVVCW